MTLDGEETGRTGTGAGSRVIVVDDNAAVVDAVRRVLALRGCDVTAFVDPRECVEALAREAGEVDALVTDMQMPDLDGLDVLARARAIDPDLAVVVLTADTSADTAVRALHAGAFDYVTKPLTDPERLATAVVRASAFARAQRRARLLEARLPDSERFHELVGDSAAMREVFSVITRLASQDVNVLVLGESGTGKELVARALHDRSPRAAGPFVALNCAALPDTLVDSELFGHVRGAYTGADASRKGAFERASGGTLFLDEIGDISLAVQVRLLRALQEREIRPLGADAPQPVDVRVIAATLVDLETAVANGEFREDLYYRLNVVTIDVPPLRARKGDVPLLAAHFLAKQARRMGRDMPRLTPGALDVFERYGWPGNVRELENAVLRALALWRGDEIPVHALPERIVKATGASVVAEVGNPGAALDVSWADDIPLVDARRMLQERFDHAYLERLLERTDGNVSAAARIAGVERSNFRRILTRLGLR